ncbi:hypothetical protein CF392_09515 [Tamilnaduibacter salinus]|uniref:Uncharacterized protein n=1 Tax=Tamilnaduibacter salinus TaxID=1484056 RepID=A0A2A2I380_9GAMM|nr:hypothetical protein [Tamilnaduibacter salinus]PAV25754.1 hypothetical protein CF392_09515 [Tamilnaduibacter salinus]
MKKKVYLSIFASLILAVCVSSIGGVFGEVLVEHVNTETAELALEGRSISDFSREEANALMRSPEFVDRLVAAKKEVSDEYWWYFGANFAIQILLILVICLVCGKFVIHTVAKHARP